MAPRGKKKTTKAAASKATRGKASAKKASAKKASAKKAPVKAAKPAKPKKFPPVKPSAKLNPKASKAVKSAADALWDVGVSPHELLKELHEVLLLRCLSDAQGNYASAAKLFGPSRQSVQQYANSSLRDERWQPYQQNHRKA